ncbi:hypothetical protein [Streptomyces lancefieldiae]|uniref:Integrase n=1 Tax=Streptomyces lancefieldiae TaxID=3075520 RepID=A0ABU3B186_9ACTN|nr:hypothetical protein [Streptomyces sp. DSM 40712]MDT0615043.1 hypothetical protein [Streptomyces sp. DSM 40712]
MKKGWPNDSGNVAVPVSRLCRASVKARLTRPENGGPRSLPRREGTVWLYLNRVRPALLEWSNRYDHLREVTRDDVLTHIKTLHGRLRHDQLVALRSLFTWAKRTGRIWSWT